MSRGSERESDVRQRRRSEPEAREEEVIRLREAVEEDARTIEALRGAQDQDAARIHQLEEEAVESDRIERAQRALIQGLRAEVGDAADDMEAIGERLRGRGARAC